MNVLLIDDQINEAGESYLSDIRRVCDGDGIDFYPAEGLDEAKQVWDRRDIAVVVLDLMFGNDLTAGGEMLGFEYIDRLLRELPFTPIIVYSQRSELANAIKSLQKGAFTFVSKLEFDSLGKLRDQILQTAANRQAIVENYFSSNLPVSLAMLYSTYRQVAGETERLKVLFDFVDLALRLLLFIRMRSSSPTPFVAMHEFSNLTLGLLRQLVVRKTSVEHKNLEQVFAFLKEKKVRGFLDDILELRNSFAHRPSVVHRSHAAVFRDFQDHFLCYLKNLSRYSIVAMDSQDRNGARLVRYRGDNPNFLSTMKASVRPVLQSDVLYLHDPDTDLCMDLSPFLLLRPVTQDLTLLFPYYFNKINTRTGVATYHNYYMGESFDTEGSQQFDPYVVSDDAISS